MNKQMNFIQNIYQYLLLLRFQYIYIFNYLLVYLDVLVIYFFNMKEDNFVLLILVQ